MSMYQVDLSLFPVGAICKYPGSQTVQVLRSGQPMLNGKKTRPGKREEITKLTQKSIDRLLFIMTTTTETMRSLLTVTYLCPPSSGKQAKADLRCILQWVKRQYDQIVNYCWFLEFTKAGAVHYHILLTEKVTEALRHAWARYWSKKTATRLGPYCSLRTKRQLDPELAIFDKNTEEETWANLRKPDGAARYVVKYGCKMYQKAVPIWYSDVGRFWGVSQGVRDAVPYPDVVPMDEDELREHLFANRHKVGDWTVIPKYIWGFPDTT